jgi:rhamnosyltransferase
VDQSEPAISVILPVKNGGAVLLETLRALLRQRIEGRFEVIVIDSESRDGSAEATERLFADPEANPQRIPLVLKRITAREFGHGRTRNMGARLANGALVVFLSQDATPVGTAWLARFVQPFAEPEVVGAFCRQVARPEASLPERFILETAYPPRASQRTHASLQQRDAGYILFSNAAGAIRRTALMDQPFDEQRMMCEDAEWAVRVLTAGRTIAYVADAQVVHSHHYTLRAIMGRNFDFAVTLAGLPGSMGPRSYIQYLRRELAFVLREGGPAALPWALAFESVRCAGYLLGNQHRRLPTWLCRWLSGYPHWFGSPAQERAIRSTLDGQGRAPERQGVSDGA